MEWFRDHLWETWLGAAILLGVAEMFSLDLILLMIALGALVGVVLDLLNLPFVVQALGAAAASLACLTLVRPTLTQRLRSGPSLTVGHGKLVGHHGVVTEPIGAREPGRIKLGGEIWSAAAYDDTGPIGTGETVQVLEIRGATAYVVQVPSLEA